MVYTSADLVPETAKWLYREKLSTSHSVASVSKFILNLGCRSFPMHRATCYFGHSCIGLDLQPKCVVALDPQVSSTMNTKDMFSTTTVPNATVGAAMGLTWTGQFVDSNGISLTTDVLREVTAGPGHNRPRRAIF